VITYGLDRWSVAAGGAAVTMQRLGTVGANYLNITGAASNTIVNIRQRIESQNIADLAGQQVTVSFICSASVATSVSVTLGYASAQDNFSTVTTIGTVAKTINSVGNRYDCQFTLPAGAANGVEVIFGISNMTSGTFALTNVQLEAGAVATPFERRTYGTELALCQRYYQKTYNIGTAVPTATTSGALIRYIEGACSYATLQWVFNTSMRDTPTVTVYNPVSNATSSLRADASNVNAGINFPGTNGVSIYVANSALTANVGVYGQATASSEL
jgi:hypothetical protein